GIRRDAVGRLPPIAEQVDEFTAQREVERRAEEGALVALQRHAGPAAAQDRTVGGIEILAVIQRGAERVGTPAANQVAAERAHVSRRVVDVRVERLHGLDAGEIVDSPARVEVAGEQLVRGAANLVAARIRSRGTGRSVGRIRGGVLVEEVGAEAAIRAAAPVVAIFAADALAYLGIPVVSDRQVLAAVDGPEERVR